MIQGLEEFRKYLLELPEEDRAAACFSLLPEKTSFVNVNWIIRNIYRKEYSEDSARRTFYDHKKGKRTLRPDQEEMLINGIIDGFIEYLKEINYDPPEAKFEVLGIKQRARMQTKWNGDKYSEGDQLYSIRTDKIKDSKITKKLVRSGKKFYILNDGEREWEMMEEELDKFFVK